MKMLSYLLAHQITWQKLNANLHLYRSIINLEVSRQVGQRGYKFYIIKNPSDKCLHIPLPSIRILSRLSTSHRVCKLLLTNIVPPSLFFKAILLLHLLVTMWQVILVTNQWQIQHCFNSVKFGNTDSIYTIDP